MNPRGKTALITGASSGELAERINAAVGTPDIIVNNAGAGQWKFVEETSPQEAVQMMAVPYFAAFYVTHAFPAGHAAPKHRAHRERQLGRVPLRLARRDRLPCGALGGARIY